MKREILSLLAWFAGCLLLPASSHAIEWRVEVSPAVPAVQREGITGAGWAVVEENEGQGRVVLHYPNHPDDFGGSVGTGTTVSEDGGLTWSAGQDDWPIPRTVDLWRHRFRDGGHLAFGLRWVADPAKRGELTSLDVPTDAYEIGVMQDGGDWTSETAVIDFPPELGVIARPLPRIIENVNGVLHMPAYSWGKTGNRVLLLRSEDRGKHWEVLSVVTSAAAMVKAGAAVTTPWLESTIVPVSDGSWLAVARTGSRPDASLISLRSTDEGKTWSSVEKVVAGPDQSPVAGKLPGLLLLPDGPLVLLTANSATGCFLYLSDDGTGRQWRAPHTVTTSSGGNTSFVALDPRTLIVFTPANGRIDAWRIELRPLSATDR